MLELELIKLDVFILDYQKTAVDYLERYLAKDADFSKHNYSHFCY